MITPDQIGPGDEVPVIPPIDERTYEELFKLCGWMASAQPWERMLDSNSFVLIDPITGDRQIASVMGQAGSFFALHLYQPEEGTRWLTRLHLSTPDDPQCRHDAQFDQRYLEVEFTDGSEMDEQDVELVERFGKLTKAGAQKKRAPRFPCALLRSVHPGCPSWHPEQAEATRLIDGLRLLRRFYEEHFEEFEWAVFMPDENRSVSLPTFRLPEGADRADAAAWKFGMEQYQSPPPKQLPDIPVDELFVARLSKFKVKPGTRWEQGAVFSPNPTIDEGKPVYPVVAMIGDAETGRVEGLEVASSQLDRATVLRRSLTKAVEDLGYLPEELVVGSPVAELAHQDLAKSTGVRVLSGEGGMPLFDHIAQDLLNSPLFSPPDGDLPAGLADLAPESVQGLEKLLRDAPGADASQDEIVEFLQQLTEHEAGEALLGQFADSMGGDGPFAVPRQMSESGPPSEIQQELFVSEPLDPDRYVMRVDLVGMKPPIWRRISLPAESTFHDLHLALQAAFDWDDDHLHEFQVRERNRIMAVIGRGEVDNDLDEATTKLKQVFTPNIKKVHYVYDFGDCWTHQIKIEKKIPAEAGQTGSECLAGRGIAPLEDCGGIWGYQQLLDGTSELCEEFDQELLRHHREGIFSPKDVVF